MGALTGRIAVVAGASRGAGKGIALALGEAAPPCMSWAARRSMA